MIFVPTKEHHAGKLEPFQTYSEAASFPISTSGFFWGWLYIISKTLSRAFFDILLQTIWISLFFARCTLKILENYSSSSYNDGYSSDFEGTSWKEKRKSYFSNENIKKSSRQSFGNYIKSISEKTACRYRKRRGLTKCLKRFQFSRFGHQNGNRHQWKLILETFFDWKPLIFGQIHCKIMITWTTLTWHNFATARWSFMFLYAIVTSFASFAT